MLPAKNRPAGSHPPSFILVMFAIISSDGSGEDRVLSVLRGLGVEGVMVEVGVVGAGKRTMSCAIVPMN